MPKATIIIPTFNHGPLLEWSIKSALQQTISDIEVVVIGDGADKATQTVAQKMVKLDQRVRYENNPKTTRCGEEYRDEVIRQASAEIICYLSDDDMMFPDHVATVARLLKTNDFISTTPLVINTDQTFSSYYGDLALPEFQQNILKGINFVPLSCGAHTKAAYEKLPYGWRSTPRPIATDMYMWQQFLAQPNLKTQSTREFTVVNLPSVPRKNMSLDKRLAEMKQWFKRLPTLKIKPEFYRQLSQDMFQEAFLRQQYRAVYENEIKPVLDSKLWKLQAAVKNFIKR